MVLTPPRFYTLSELSNNATIKDGWSAEKEAQARRKHVRFIQDMGKELKLTSFTVEAAAVYFNRFFAVRSMQRNNGLFIAAASLYLATKGTDSPRQASDVAYVFLKKKAGNKIDELAKLSQMAKMPATAMRDALWPTIEPILKAEMALLLTMNFQLQVDYPYTTAMKVIKSFDLVNDKIAQITQNFLNDSLRTTLRIQYSASDIAHAAVYKAAEVCHTTLPIPDGKTFSEFFNIPQAVLDDFSTQVMALFQQTGPQQQPQQRPQPAAAPAPVPVPRSLPPPPCFRLPPPPVGVSAHQHMHASASAPALVQQQQQPAAPHSSSAAHQVRAAPSAPTAPSPHRSPLPQQQQQQQQQAPSVACLPKAEQPQGPVGRDSSPEEGQLPSSEDAAAPCNGTVAAASGACEGDAVQQSTQQHAQQQQQQLLKPASAIKSHTTGGGSQKLEDSANEDGATATATSPGEEVQQQQQGIEAPTRKRSAPEAGLGEDDREGTRPRLAA